MTVIVHALYEVCHTVYHMFQGVDVRQRGTGDRAPDPLSSPEFGGSAREGGAGKKQEKPVHPWPLIGSFSGQRT